MGLELVIALVAFAAPGAIAIEVWDWACHKEDRSNTSVLGHGILLSLGGYSLLQGVGLVDLTTVLSPDGEVSLAALLQRSNLATLLLTTVTMAVAAFLAGRWGHPRLARALGRSFHDSTWGAEFKLATAADGNGVAWVTIRTKSGSAWMGRPRRIPSSPKPNDYIALGQPQAFDHARNAWGEETDPVVLIPINDIDIILVNSNPGEPDASEGPDSLGEEGHAHRGQQPSASAEEPAATATAP